MASAHAAASRLEGAASGFGAAPPMPTPPATAPPQNEYRDRGMIDVSRGGAGSGRSSGRGSRINSRTPSRPATPPDVGDDGPGLLSPELRQAAGEHESEAGDLSRSLRWSAEQLRSHRAAKLLVASEESLVAVHSTVVAQCTMMLPTEQRMIEEVQTPGGDVDEYVRGLREMIQQRREQLEAMEQAIDNYEERSAEEDEARRHVKGAVGMPWA